MIYTDTLPSRTVRVAGEDWLWFSGTAYLGLGHHAVFQNYLHEGLRQFGSNFGSSRNNNLRLSIYEQAEAALAQFACAPAALTVSSGMLVGQLLMNWVRSHHLGESITYFFAPGVHPALWNEHYKPNAQTPAEWFGALPEAIAESPATHCVIATDAVGSPQVSHIPFEWVAQLPPHRPLTILIDDSHGIGVLGTGGSGIYQSVCALVKSPLHQVIVVASLNKALGVPAGVVLGSPELMASLRQMPLFAGSSPMSPAFAFALKNACETGLYTSLNTQLLEKVRYFDRLVKPLQLLDSVADYPAFCSRLNGLHEYLRSQRVLTASFAYPTPSDVPVTRLVVSALHEYEDLDQLANLCGKFMA
jgi:8-amino-7-oxononanoate synthase